MRAFSYAVATLTILTLAARTSLADFVELTASQTDTIIQGSGGGGMSGLFAGLSGQSGIHRGLLQFDLGALPSCATIESVTLSLYLLSAAGNNPPQMVHLGLHDGKHRWDGTASWTSPWTTPGGDFATAESAGQTVSKALNTTFTWSSAQMAADVQGWLDNPSTNFGWFLIGDEKDPFSVRRFATDPNQGQGAFAPTLDITYEACPTPEPASAVLLGLGAVVLGVGAARRRLAGKKG